MLLALILAILLILIASIALYAMTKQDREPSNRYVKKKKHFFQSSPRVNDSDEKKNSSLENEQEDADEILGLKETKRLTEQTRNQLPEPSAIVRPRSPLMILHVMAEPDYPYGGYDLLQALLSVGLRYGDMNIFHRHESATGLGHVLFSVASAARPGNFDLQNMGVFTCPGLSMFMKLNELKDPFYAFDLMLETAYQLAEDLGGVVLDEDRKALNRDKIIELKKNIREFKENRETADLFEDEYAKVE